MLGSAAARTHTSVRVVWDRFHRFSVRLRPAASDNRESRPPACAPAPPRLRLGSDLATPKRSKYAARRGNMSEHTREAFARIFRYLPSLRTRPRTACAPPTPPERENGATRLARSDRNRRERARATPLTLPDTMRAAAQLWGAAGHVRSLKAQPTPLYHLSILLSKKASFRPSHARARRAGEAPRTVPEVMTMTIFGSRRSRAV